MQRSLAATFAAALFAIGFDAFAIAQRTFVSTAGDDANTVVNCSLASPCRSFGSAITVTASKGEIVALDSGGYGHVTIGKSVAIVAPAGVYAGISVFFGQNGVVVDGVNVVVVLRGLTINGQGGAFGILFTQGARLYIEQCTVSNMGLHGVALLDGETFISETTIRNNGGSGIRAEGGVDVTIDGTRIEGNAASGLRLVNGPKLTMTRSVVSVNSSSGVFIDHVDTGGATQIAITDSSMSQNALYGVYAEASGATSKINLSLSRNTVNRNGYSGIFMLALDGAVIANIVDNVVARNNLEGIKAAGAGVSATIATNAVSGNLWGAAQSTNAVLKTRSNNIVQDNGTDVSGTLTFVAGD